MIKKSLFGMALGVFLLSSCTSEEPISETSDGNVTFHATLPAQLLTRSDSYNTIFDNGTNATELAYAVYDESGTNISTLNGEATISGLSADVKLNLVTGKTYTIVFWAQAPGAPYTFVPSTGKMTVTTTGNAQDLNRDAFFACEKFTVTGAVNKEVVLQRPFAQVNIGTCDFDAFTAAGGNLTTSGITVTAPTVLNLLDGTVDIEEEYTLTPAEFVDNESRSINFPVTTTPAQKYLTTAFILVDRTRSTVDVKWTSDNAERPEVTYAHIPVQRNYRTNIYGHLLTNPTGFSVTINEVFETENININKDEELADGVYYNKGTKTYTVSTGEGLKWVAENIRLTGSDKLLLDNDIDMNGEVVTPLNVAFEPTGSFILDGQGHTIKNLLFEGDKASLVKGSVVGTIKNLNIDGMTGSVTKRFAGLIGNLYGNVENVHVKNVHLESTEGRIGAIVGIHNSGTMTDCSVENVTINGGWSVGGVIGAINETANRTYKNIRVANVSISTDAAWGGNAAYKGTITGDIYKQGIVFENCSIEGTVEGCDSPELPIDVPDFAYTWNGTLINAAE